MSEEAGETITTETRRAQRGRAATKREPNPDHRDAEVTESSPCALGVSVLLMRDFCTRREDFFQNWWVVAVVSLVAATPGWGGGLSRFPAPKSSRRAKNPEVRSKNR